MAMTPSEMIEVLQHFVDGGMIEFRSTIVDDDDYLIWQDAVVPTWNFDDFDYRIKPKPLEGWTNVDDYGHSSGFLHMSHEGAIVSQCKTYHRTVHMREVVDEDS